MAYDETKVKVERSQAQIRDLLRKFGAEGSSFNELRTTDSKGIEHWMASTQFVHRGQQVRMMVEMKTLDEKELQAKIRRARSRTRQQIVAEEMQQEERRIWRVLFYTIKARLVSVEEHVETFEQAFFAHLIDPWTGKTLYESVQPLLESGAFKVGGAGLLALPRGGE